MAVTRIKSNQITDGAVTNVKVADYSIQGGKLANSFTYGSDFTVSGNLTVNGTTTTVDTVTTTIDDPILLLASNQSGNGSVDIGILGERGDDTNVFMGYDESADEFVMALTSTGDSNSAVTVTDYVTTHVGGLTVDDNATVAGTATVTGNITGGNLTTAGLTSTATLTTSGEATLASATVSDLTAGRMVYVTGSGELSDQANLTFNGSQLGTPSLVATGAVTGATMTATGNITGGNLLTGNVTIADSTISAAGDVTLTANGADFITFYGNVDAGNGKGTFNNVQAQTVQNAYGNLELYAGSGSHVKVPTGNSVVIEDIGNTHIVYSNNGELEGGAGLTYNGTELYADNGNIGGYLAVTGNVTGGNLNTTGLVSVTGNITGGNLIASEYVYAADGNISGTFAVVGDTNLYANASVGGTLGVTGEATLASATVSDLTAGRVVYVTGSGELSDQANLTFNGSQLGAPSFVASGAVTGASMTATGAIQGANVTATDTLTGGNVKIAGDGIYVQTGTLVINEAGNDTDLRIEGSSNANLVYVNAGLDNVGIGGIPSNGNCTLCIESTDAMKLPVGTTAQRPTGTAGMIRYNSSTDQVEAWDVTEATFKQLGVPSFTVIASEAFDGDGSTTVFTLSDDQTTQSCIVSINGVVQLPTSAYAVSGNAMTFTEAPETGDKIEVRKLTTTSTVASLSNGDQSVTIECADSQVEITGDVVVTGNLTFSGQNFLGQYNHSNVYVVTSGNETTNTGSTLALTAATLGFDLTQASYYQVFMNRQLLRPDEITVNLTNGTITFASDTVAENDEIEAVFLAT